MTVFITRSPDGVQTLRFPHLATPHGIAGRTGGISTGRYASLNLGPKSGDDPACVRANRDRFLAALALTETIVVAPRQLHSAEVAVHRRGEALPPGRVFEGDALVTDAPGITLVILAADCAPVLLHDSVRGVVAAAHAGWRGTAGGIAAATVRRMTEAFGCRPADIRAGIGPAIGRCCYEVGADVVDAIGAVTPGGAAPLCDPRPGGKAHIDIAAANRAQLVGAGLAPANIGAAGICTACRTDLFYSHRREGEPTGRNGAAIALIAPATSG